MQRLIYIIDQQSVNSLATYDWKMIENIKDIKIHFFGNVDYNEKTFNNNVSFTPIFKYGRYNNSILKGLSYFFSLIVIIFWCMKERPTIFHMQWIRLWYIDWPFIKILKGYYRAKFIFTVHNILPRKRNAKTFDKFLKIYKYATKLIVHTETTKRDLQKRFGIIPSKIVVMPHGILELNINNKDLKETEKLFRTKYDLANKIIFGALGVQSPYKGTDLLIEAWKKTSSLYNAKSAVLIIAGKPSGIELPEDLPKNIIVIPRLLTNCEFQYLIQRIDVMVLPYREIEQSGILLTLINEEKPYCCTKVGELSRPIEKENIGWIIDDCNQNSIAETLIEILANTASIYKKKNNKIGWGNLKKYYSWEQSNSILKATYIELLNQDR